MKVGSFGDSELIVGDLYLEGVDGGVEGLIVEVVLDVVEFIVGPVESVVDCVYFTVD